MMPTFRRFVSQYALHASAVVVVGFAACADPECPDGTYRVRNVCRRVDAGVSADEAAVSANAPDASSMESVGTGFDGGRMPNQNPSAPTSTSDAAAGTDATPAADDGGAQSALDSAAGSAVECDLNRACASGYSCNVGKCVSACVQTTCDPNATCSLANGAATCSCNNGFVAQGSGIATKCVRDAACSELGCHANANCSIGSDGLRHCTCKMGYAGNGMSCAPVSCQPLSIENGTVTGGTNFEQASTYRCNTGYSFASGVGNTTRTCGADQQWSGTAPRCDPVSCGLPPVVSHATVTPTSAGTLGAQATYTCDRGYALSGNPTITCGASGWSTRPSCAATCGNNVKEADEECDPTAPGTNRWKCSPTCARQTLYSACFQSSDCSSGEVCYNRMCTLRCNSSAGCPAPPVGSGMRSCDTAVGYCALISCASASDCAPGLVCQNTNGTFCGGCISGEQCAAGVCAADSARTPVSLGMWGVCP